MASQLEYVIGDDDDEDGSIGAAYEIVGQEYEDDDDDYEDDDDNAEMMNALGISGLGNTEIVGRRAIRRRRPSARRRRLRTARRVIDRNAAVVETSPLTRKRRYLLGFTPTIVAAAASVIIAANPQNLFRAERLVVPSDIAFDLGIQNIVIGTQNQFAQATEVPAAVFSEVAIDTSVIFDTAEVGNQIAIDVRNKTGAPVEFTAAMLGTLAKP